jgi:hypothetical protein
MGRGQLMFLLWSANVGLQVFNSGRRDPGDVGHTSLQSVEKRYGRDTVPDAHNWCPVGGHRSTTRYRHSTLKNNSS